MKTYKLTMIYTFFAAAALLSACEGSEGIDGGDEAVPMRFTADISAAATRAVDQTWYEDNIGVMVTADSLGNLQEQFRNVLYETESSGTTTASFSPADENGMIYMQKSDGTVSFAAYAPYQQSDDAATLPGEEGVIAASTETQTTSAEQQAIDFLFAEGTGSAADPEVNFTFSHVMSKLVLSFKVNDSYVTFEDLQGADFMLSGIRHEGTFRVNPESAGFGKASLNADAAVGDWDITDMAHEDSDSVRTYSFILFPQDLSGGVTIYLTVDGFKFSANIAPNLRPGEETAYTLELKQERLTVTGSTVESWGTGGSASPIAGFLKNVIDLATVTTDTTITENVTLTGTSNWVTDDRLNHETICITFAEGVTDIIFKNAKFAKNMLVAVNTTATIHLIGKNEMSCDAFYSSPISVTGTESDPSTLTITGSDADTLSVGTYDNNFSTCVMSSNAYSHINISGGVLNLSTKGDGSHCIGGEDVVNACSGNITITGGQINASTGGTYSNCIGGAGLNGTSGDINITGGIITALVANSSSCAIGASSEKAGNITISGGTVTAEAADSTRHYSVAIGVGGNGSCGDILITGSKTTVIATSSLEAYNDIGLRSLSTSSSCGTVTIADGAVVRRKDDNKIRIYGH